MYSRRTSTSSYTASVMATVWTTTRGRGRRRAVRRTSDRTKPERWSALKPNSTTNRDTPRRSRWRRRERYLQLQSGVNTGENQGGFAKLLCVYLCSALRCTSRGRANRRMMTRHQKGRCQLTCWTERANHAPKSCPTWSNRRGKRKL